MNTQFLSTGTDFQRRRATKQHMKKFVLSLFAFAVFFTCSFGFGSTSKPDADSTSLNSQGTGIEQQKAPDIELTQSDAASYSTTQIRTFSSFEENLFAPQELNLVPFSAPAPLSPQDEYHTIRAQHLLAKVKAENRFVKFLDASALIDLPVGVVSEGGNEDYAILVDSLVITPTHAYLTVYMCIPVPQSEKSLVFRGDNIRLSKDAGITGDARIFLVNDVAFNLFGSQSQMIVRGGADKTFAVWDCNGYKETTLTADVEFSRNWVVPVNGQGNVNSHFQTTIADWNDLVVNVNLDPFTLPSLQGVEFHTANAVFDYSDFHTPDLIQFPQGYNSPYFLNGDKRLWRGFYMEDLTVKLPQEFKQRGESDRVTFSGQHMIIDNLGFSGSVGVANLFTLQQGDMNGWVYSIDSLGFSLVSNDLTGAGFRGNLVLPVSDEDKPFSYTAIINPGSSYVFNVRSLDSLNFDIWKAKVQLQENSYLDIQVVNGKFRPKAVLTGSMNVQAQTDEMSLLDVQFEELLIMTEAPYLDAKAFSFGSEQLEHTLKDFPVSISDIGFRKKEDNIACLSFNVGIHLTGQNDGAFKGDATLEVNGVLDAGSGKWKYDGVTISEVGVDIDGGSYSVKGRLKIFEKDLIYGKGYNGTAELSFQPGIEVTGTVIFGKVDGYRYWFADAFVGFSTGIPFCGPLAFYGFGGGMYHNMEQVGFSTDQNLSAGKSLSGVIYKPNKEVRYGFKATVQVGLSSSKETFNGDVTFEMSFNKSGGVRRISLVGNAYVFMNSQLGDVTELTAMVEEMSIHQASYGYADSDDIKATSGLKPPGKDALISGHLFQYYDFENDVLHGEMEMYVDVVGAIKGTGPNGLAGWSVVHYSREEWFMYIGTPDRRVGLSVLGMIKMDGYFMSGDNIPGSPPPPAEVASILGNVDLDYMRDENALGTGKGVAFGASFSITTGNMTFLMFYGRFGLGGGFDVMLKNYGSQVQCKGSSSTLGINGWYANGQAYAFVEGEIGIKVKIFYKRKRIKILSIGAAVVLQSKLPNPVWMKGIVGGRFSVLGGLVRGHCRFELEIGDQCEIVNDNALEGITVIADLAPASGLREVDVFTTPQAVFNFEINKQFSLRDIDNQIQTFRIKLDHFRVKDGNTVIPADLVWSGDNTVAGYKSVDVFSPNKEFLIEVQVSFEELVNGVWTPVKIDGTVLTETKSAVFFTGEAPDYIPLNNIAYSYPQLNQFNFYKSEYPQGYIKLKRGQPYLFETSEAWEQKGRFVTAGGSTSYVDFSYQNQEITFSIPADLQNEKVYTIQIVNLPSDNQAGGIDANLKAVSSKVANTDVEISSRRAKGTIRTLQEHVLFEGFFRTSKFNTFSDKFDKLNLSRGWYKPDPRAQGIFILGSNMFASEYFDKAELSGTGEYPGLVRIQANLNDNRYYQKKIYPLVYHDYTSLTPYAEIGQNHNYGVPPVKATFFIQDYTGREVTEADIANDGAVNPASSGILKYELNYYMYRDYQELQRQTANYITYANAEITPRRRYIIEKSFPVIESGPYQVQVEYVLPGTGKVTTRKSFSVFVAF